MRGGVSAEGSGEHVRPLCSKTSTEESGLKGDAMWFHQARAEPGGAPVFSMTWQRPGDKLRTTGRTLGRKSAARRKIADTRTTSVALSIISSFDYLKVHTRRAPQ